MTHAGFWVDGAVRKPESKHFDSGGCVVAKWKDEKIGTELDFCLCGFERWNHVYWLDTTPRESLTPEELFSMLKVIWPGVEMVHKHNGASWYVDDIESGVRVDWDGLTQYPPPVETQWICVTKENVKSYLFCACRFRNSTSHEWRSGVLCGWHNQDCCCLVDSDYVEEIPIMSWKYVEVQA